MAVCPDLFCVHITTLQSTQSLQVYVTAGTLLHLSVGQVVIQIPSLEVDAYAYTTQIYMPEGAVYAVEHSGWIQISARRRSEILTQLPEPTMAVRFWCALKNLTLRWWRRSWRRRVPG